MVGRALSAEYTGSADYRSCEYGRLDHRAAQLPDCCLRSTKRALRPSHKAERRHAYANPWRKDCPQGRKAGKQSGAGSKYVVYQQEVAELRTCLIRRLTVVCCGESSFDIAGFFRDAKSSLGLGSFVATEDVAAQGNAHGICDSAGNDLGLIISPLPLPCPM